MPKPDPKALKLFEAVVPKGPTIKVKPMFGNFGVFASGKMFMGIFGDQVFVKLGEEERAKAMAVPGAKSFEPMKGRPMKGYVVLPPSLLADKAKAKSWVDRSIHFVAATPSKSAPSPNRKRARK